MASYWDRSSNTPRFVDATHHVPPPPRVRGRVVSPAVYKCSCERERGTSTTHRSYFTSEQNGRQLRRHHSSTRGHKPCPLWRSQTMKARGDSQWAQRCRVSLPLTAPSIRRLRQRQLWRPVHHLPRAAVAQSPADRTRPTLDTRVVVRI